VDGNGDGDLIAAGQNEGEVWLYTNIGRSWAAAALATPKGPRGDVIWYENTAGDGSA
jgi:hypothetical protein